MICITNHTFSWGKCQELTVQNMDSGNGSDQNFIPAAKSVTEKPKDERLQFSKSAMEIIL